MTPKERAVEAFAEITSHGCTPASMVEDVIEKAIIDSIAENFMGLAQWFRTMARVENKNSAALEFAGNHCIEEARKFSASSELSPPNEFDVLRVAISRLCISNGGSFTVNPAAEEMTDAVGHLCFRVDPSGKIEFQWHQVSETDTKQ